MFYVDSTAEAWQKKYGLDIEKKICKNCGKEFNVNVPIRIKGYAGFEMIKHGCPDNFLSATFTPTSREAIESWGKII